MKKSTKKKGIIHKGKLIVFGVLVVLVLLFSYFFKNKLAAQAIEQGMEAAFKTNVTVSGVKLQILSSSLHINFLSVLDDSHPDKNLFELHNMTADIDTAALLKGRIIIEKLEASGLQWGTPSHLSQKAKASSLPDKRNADKKRSSFAFPRLSFNPREIIQTHRGDFASIKAIDRSKTRLIKAKTELETKTDTLKEEIKTLTAEIKTLSRMKVSSVQEGAELLQKIQTAEKTVNTLQKGSTELYTSIAVQRTLLNNEKHTVKKSLADDYKKIDSFIASPGESLRNAASTYTRELLKRKTGRYYALVVKGMTIAKNISSENTKKRTYERRKGRTVFFPVKKLPRFLLKKASLEMVKGEEDLAIILKNLSSNPDITGKQTIFSADYRKGTEVIDINGIVNLSQGEMKLRAETQNVHFSTDAVEADYSARGSFSLHRGGTLSGKGRLLLHTLTIINKTNKDLFKERINTILRHTHDKTIYAAVTKTNNKTSVTVKTSLDKLFSKAVDSYTAEASSKLKKQTRKVFDEQIHQSLQDWGKRTEEMEQLFKQGKIISDKIKTLQKQLKKEESRIEKEILKSKASNSGKTLLKKAEKIKLPSF